MLMQGRAMEEVLVADAPLCDGKPLHAARSSNGDPAQPYMLGSTTWLNEFKLRRFSLG